MEQSHTIWKFRECEGDGHRRPGVRRIGSQTAVVVERQIREWRAEERGQWDKLIAVVVWLQRKLRIADVSAVPTAAWERSLGRKQRSAARMVIFAASAVHREPAAAAAAPAVATAADLRTASPGVDNAAAAITVATPALRAGGAAQATAATPPTRRRSKRLKKKVNS